MKRHDLSTYEGLLGAIEELTPWGSEFYRDPEHCMDYLARQRELIKEGVKENQRLRAVVEAAVARQTAEDNINRALGERRYHKLVALEARARAARSALRAALDAFATATDAPRIGKTHTAEMLEHE